jgi:hypothetical protein
MSTADSHLAAAVRRASNPEEFNDPKYNLEIGVSAAEVQAAARHFQSRADCAYSLYGLGAPPKSPFESLTNYRQRLCDGLKVYSDAAKEVDFSRIPRNALPPFEKILIDDAIARFEKPEGPMRSCVRRDNAGREVTHFFGDERAAWLPFTNDVNQQGQHVGTKVVRIAVELGTGANSHEARALRGREAARIAAGLAMLDAAQAAAGAGASGG